MTLSVFQFDITGNDNNDEQPENTPNISLTLEVFHSDRFDNEIKDEQLQNISPMS